MEMEKIVLYVGRNGEGKHRFLAFKGIELSFGFFRGIEATIYLFNDHRYLLLIIDENERENFKYLFSHSLPELKEKLTHYLKERIAEEEEGEIDKRVEDMFIGAIQEVIREGYNVALDDSEVVTLS